MDQHDLAELRRDLDFEPRQAWLSDLPAMCWGQWILTSWQKNSGHAIDIQNTCGTDFLTAFYTCHPRLTLPEIARIYRRWESLSDFKAEINLDWNVFFKLYKLEDNEQLRRKLLSLSSTPIAFQNWLSHYCINLDELDILQSTQNDSLLQLVGARVAQFSPPKAAGLQAFIWSCELFFMGHLLEDILQLDTVHFEDWLGYLYSQKHLDLSDNQNVLEKYPDSETTKPLETPPRESFLERIKKLT